MTDQIKIKKAEPERGKQAHRCSHSLDRRTWQVADADRFLFKGQCYDAGPDSESTCGVCDKHIRLCYVLKVLESPDLFSPEIGRLTVGECCFKPIKAVSEKLYGQLLAAAINLRTFMEAVQRDEQVFAGNGPDEVECPPLSLGADKELAAQMFELLIARGGDHA